MRVALTIRSGPEAGRVAHLEAGGTLRVGRAHKADLTLSADAQVSGLHFALSLGESGCELRDLESSNGTFLNGERVSAARLRDGDRVRAGDTSFLVRFEATTAAVAPQPLPASAALSPATPAGRVQSILRDEPEPCYALLDAARDRRVGKLLRSAPADDAASLYDGWQGEMLADYAPHLVRLAPESALLEAILREGWGRSWGVFLTSARKLTDVRRHFRRFLIVKDDDTGEDLYFRFYDPRVLRTFLGCCTPKQAGMLFDDVGAFLLEDEAPETLLRFSAREGAVKRTAIPLSPRD